MAGISELWRGFQSYGMVFYLVFAVRGSRFWTGLTSWATLWACQDMANCVWSSGAAHAAPGGRPSRVLDLKANEEQSSRADHPGSRISRSSFALGSSRRLGGPPGAA